LGIDPGGVNTGGVFVAEERVMNGDRYVQSRYYIYREYHAGNRTARQHTALLTANEPPTLTAYGGAPSEGQWRDEFTQSGLYLGAPSVADVEVGINRVYSLFKNNQLFIFDDLPELLDEIGSYSRETDEMGNPTEAIADKSTYHLLDALRYVAQHFVEGETMGVKRYA
jgi:hypothetical protein